MKAILVISWLTLVVILSAHGLEQKEDITKVTPNVKEKTTESETKDKRQLGSRETSVYPNAKQDDPEQPQETIYGSKANTFLIRPLSPHEQQLRNYQPSSRPQSQQLQALGTQLEQSQEIQHFAYLQDISRNHQAKADSEGKSHILPKKPSTVQLQQQYVPEEQYAQSVQSQAQPRIQHNAGPSQYLSQQQQLQQQPQKQYSQFQSIQEEHLLKLIEEELQARALQEAQARASYAKPSPQVPPNSAEQQSLGSYRSKSEETPEYVRYSQPEQPAPHQGPQYLPLTGQQPIRSQPQPQQHLQAREQPQNFYQDPSQVSYRTLPNHPLAESSLEREIEKLLASNKPAGYRHSHPPAVLSTRSPFIQKKSYSTTVSPLTTIAQASQYSFSPSVVQYNGFQPSPTVPSVPIDHQQHKKFAPNAYSTSRPQYQVLQTSQAPTKPGKSYSSPGQYHVKQQQKSKPQLKQNLGPVQFYYNDPQQQQQQLQQQQQQQQLQQQQQQLQQQQQQQQQHQHHQQQSQPSLQSPEYPQYPISGVAPSQSSIFVSQSTGLRPSPKTKGASKPLGLPPANSKPISQAEFQALVDAGYPVEAVHVPVPIPYEQYIKNHPEYQGQQVEVPHHHAQRGVAGDGSVTYLRPLPHEQHQHQPRHPREQTEEVVPGKTASS